MGLKPALKARFGEIVVKGEMEFNGKAKRSIAILERLGLVTSSHEAKGDNWKITVKPTLKGARAWQDGQT